MKRFTFTISTLVFTISTIFASAANITSELPSIRYAIEEEFLHTPDVAQYKNADWGQVVGIAKGISLQEAYRIAAEDPAITFFFYTKGYQMVLETTSGDYRIFHHGDTVFFAGEPWWGSAPGLADGYTKK